MPHMNADAAWLTAEISHLTASGNLNVVMACHDYSAGMHALCLFDRLFYRPESKIPPGAQSIWKFDMLGIAALREIAVQEGAAADLVIISTHASEGLPNAVKIWMNAWTERHNGRPGALVLILDDFVHHVLNPSSVEFFVQERAKRAGMTFVVHKSDGRHAFEDFERAANPEKRARTFANFRENLLAGAVEQFHQWSAGNEKQHV